MNVSKKYNSSFVVEKSKLTRLLSVINERMALLQQPIQQTYETHLSGQKNVTNSSIEEILSLDNSRRSKIERLVLLQKSVTQVPAVTEHQIEVDFDGKSPTDVTVSIRGTDARWVTESMSVVEEQVERTLEKTLFHLLFNSRAMVFFIALVIFLLAGVASLRYPALNSRSDPLANTMWLSPMDLTALGKSLEQSTLSPADRIADVQTRQLRNLISAQTDSPFSFLTDWRVLIAMSPLIFCS